MKYAAALNGMVGNTFRREEALDAMLREFPGYNPGSFNRHFSRMLSQGLIERVGRGLYVVVSPDTARGEYSHRCPSERFSKLSSFLVSEFPLSDFLLFETVQLNEFFDHQTAQNLIIVEAESILMEAIFERTRAVFPSVMFSPKAEDIRRYAEDGSIAIVRLSSRHPKNKADKHGCSIEKLAVDIFAERTIRSLLNEGDYPSALEDMFKRYRVNETALLNYARTRRVDAKIRQTLGVTGVTLFTGGVGIC